MNKKRKQNEKEYHQWEDLENQGRIYKKVIKAGDNSGKTAHYEKVVDKDEKLSVLHKRYTIKLVNY